MIMINVARSWFLPPPPFIQGFFLLDSYAIEIRPVDGKHLEKATLIIKKPVRKLSLTRVCLGGMDG